MVAVFTLGLVFGSFINALVWRLQKQQKSKTSKYSITKGRSMCPHCRHTLTVADLIPVISWLSLGGRCRYCKKPISRQYPLVELLTGLLFVISYSSWPYAFDAAGWLKLALWLLILTGLIALFIYDLKWQLLPNKIVFPLIGLAAAYVLISLSTGVLQILSVAYSLLVASGFFYALFQLSNGRYIGGGDVKLGIVYGLFLGDPLKSGLVLFLASLLGCIVLLPAIMSKSVGLKSKIPFGPFLIAASIFVFLYGDRLVSWYRNILYL